MSLNSSSGAVGSGRGPGVAQKIWPLLLLENANRLKCVKQADICLLPRLCFSVYTNLERMIKKWGNLQMEHTITELYLEKKIMEIL